MFTSKCTVPRKHNAITMGGVRLHKVATESITEPGVENVSDHGTIGPRKFLGLPENILAGEITTV